jgi:hypothetical protein
VRQLIAMAAGMNNSTRDEIVGLELQADELADRIERCRKFILAGWVAIATGGLVLLTMLLGLIESDPSILGLAVAAVLGGIVTAGSNRSTANEATMELMATRARRAELISQLDLRVVSDREVGEGLHD